MHYPGTYAHGVYNRESTILGRHPIPNEDLVNLPRCLSLKLCIEGEEPVRLENILLLSYRHTYDVRHAVLMRELRFSDRAGRETSLRSRRFVSMGRMHLVALEWRTWRKTGPGGCRCFPPSTAGSSTMAWRAISSCRGGISTLRDRALAPDVIALKARTRQSRIEIAQAARTRVYRASRN